MAKKTSKETKVESKNDESTRRISGMNFRHKYAYLAVRLFLGVLFIFSGITGLMAGKEMKGVPEPMVANSQALWAMGIFQMIKITEIVSGLMLIFNFLPALASLFIAPISIGIIVVNSMIAPEYIISGILVCVLNAYLGYYNWDKYKAIFQRT